LAHVVATILFLIEATLYEDMWENQTRCQRYLNQNLLLALTAGDG